MGGGRAHEAGVCGLPRPGPWMIPIIGVMIGLYIVTRMVELIGTSTKPYLRVLGAIALVGNILGIIFLVGHNDDLSLAGGLTPTAIPSLTPTSFAPDSSLAANAPVLTWEVSESKNPLDDSPIVTLMLTATSGASSSGVAPALFLRCKSKTTDAYINWNAYLGSDAADVVTRIGKARADRRAWGLSTDNTSTFYPADVPGFIRALMRVDTLVASVTPYESSPITAVFPVTGLSDRIAPLEQACGWH